MRSDGATNDERTLVFQRAGTQRVTETWTLGGESLSSYNGWVAIKTLAPNEKMSLHRSGLAGSFSMTCASSQSATQPAPGREKGAQVAPAQGRTSGVATGGQNQPAEGHLVACPVKEVKNRSHNLASRAVVDDAAERRA